MKWLWCVLALAGLTAGAEGLRWRWSNPLPHGNNVNDLIFDAAKGYVQAGDRGQLYTSTDAVRWRFHETGTRRQLRAVTFLGDRLIATGEAGTIVWSDDRRRFQSLALGTDDWLEAVAASPSRAVAVGDRGAVYLSDDGTNWIARPLPPEQSVWLRGVTWSSGGFFAAVGESGRVLVSPDGETWTPRDVTPATTEALNRIAWTGSGFVVAGDAGTVILGNAAGTSWVRQQGSGAVGNLNVATPGANFTRLLAGNREVRLATVFGSVVWSDETDEAKPAPAPRANYLSGVYDGVDYVLGARTGLLVFGTIRGLEGYEWTIYPSPAREWLFGLTSATATGTNISVACTDGGVAYLTNRTTNRFYSAVGDRATLLYSDNGSSWTVALAPASASNSVYLGVGGNARGLVAVGSQGTVSFSPVAYEPVVTTYHCTNNSVVSEVMVTNQFNTLGLAWYAQTSPATNDLQAVAASDTHYIIAGADGMIAGSEDGMAWTARESGTSRFLSGLVHWAGGFVAVGDGGTVLTSPDGQQWSPQTSGTDQWLYRVRQHAGLLVAVGQGGTILTSPDAVQWTLRPTGVTNWLNDAAFVHDLWVAVGNQGTVLTSPDGMNWTRDEGMITGKSLYGAAAIDGQLVTAGIEGIILRAQVGPFPDPVTIGNFPHQPDEGLFLFLGRQDQHFRLERSSLLPLWQPGEELEITDPSGVLLHLDETPNDPDRQFFRARELP